MKAMGKVTLTLGLMIIVSLFLTSCSGVVTPELQLDLDEDINTVTPEIASGNLENQEDINQSSNNFQSSSTGTVEEPAIEESATAKVDTTKPVITGSRAPLPNSFDWNNTDVTVSFSCEDVGPVQSGIETNTVAGKTLTTEGIDQSVTNTGVCIDAAGNTADPVTVSNIHIDKTPPVVTLTLPGNGKYDLNESITAAWSATDDLSGVDVSKAKKTISIDTKSKGKKKITLPAGIVKDKAGNSSQEVNTYYEVLEVDTTKPVITGSRAPLPNSFGWNNSNVTVSFSCADTGVVQSGIDINTVAGGTLTTEGKDQSVTNTGVCIDAAGNTADPVTVSNINIDKTPPEVMITLPGTGEYVQNQSITATWSATDALSGVVSPVSGTVSIDTSSVGTKTFTLPAGTAMDKAGNSSLKVTKSYSVIADTEDPGTGDTEDPETVYPQKWATGDGTVENPWANNCIVSAYNACPTGGTIYLRAGYYLVPINSEYGVRINKSINIIGEGIGKTIIVTSDAHGFYIDNCDHVTLKGMTIDGDAATDEEYIEPIQVHTCSYITLEDIEVKNSARYGIDFNTVNYSLVQNLYSHDNWADGIHPGTNETGWNMHNVYRNLYLYDNGIAGFNDVGNQVYTDEDLHNVYDNIQAWDNGAPGIFISQQRSGVISNCYASNNGGVGFDLIELEDFNINNCFAIGNIHGMYLEENCNNINIDNCSVSLNAESGIHIVSSDNINITNVIAKNNNASSSYGIGIAIDGCNDVTLTSCLSYDDREPPLQSWGITIEGTNTGISLLNCKLTPNAIAEIYNPAGAEVTVITEKMLAKF